MTTTAPTAAALRARASARPPAPLRRPAVAPTMLTLEATKEEDWGGQGRPRQVRVTRRHEHPHRFASREAAHLMGRRLVGSGDFDAYDLHTPGLADPPPPPPLPPVDATPPPF